MLSVLVYLVACTAISVVLSSIFLAFRPIKNVDENAKPWTVMLLVWLLVIGAPYGFVEMQTKKHRIELDQAIKNAYSEADIRGNLKYYKIVSFRDNKARALVVGEEESEVAGIEHPVVSVELTKTSEGWTAESYSILASGRLNQDKLVLPPYF